MQWRQLVSGDGSPSTAVLVVAAVTFSSEGFLPPEAWGPGVSYSHGSSMLQPRVTASEMWGSWLSLGHQCWRPAPETPPSVLQSCQQRGYIASQSSSSQGYYSTLFFQEQEGSSEGNVLFIFM